MLHSPAWRSDSFIDCGAANQVIDVTHASIFAIHTASPPIFPLSYYRGQFQRTLNLLYASCLFFSRHRHVMSDWIDSILQDLLQLLSILNFSNSRERERKWGTSWLARSRTFIHWRCGYCTWLSYYSPGEDGLLKRHTRNFCKYGGPASTDGRVQVHHFSVQVLGTDVHTRCGPTGRQHLSPREQ